MTIVFLHASPFPKYSGGIDNWLYHIIGQLDKGKVHVMVICPSSKAQPFYDLSPYGNIILVETASIQNDEKYYQLIKKILPSFSFIPVALAYLRWSISATLILRRYVKKQDKIIVLQPLPAMLPVAICKLLGMKNTVICYMRGRVGADLKELKHELLSCTYIVIERFLLSLSNATFSNGKDTALYVKQELKRESTVIPNGVDFSSFSIVSINRENPWIAEIKRLKEAGCKIVMTVATLRDVKGIKYLIEAAPYLLQENKVEDFKIVFVGKGDPSAYRHYGEKFGVEEKLLFVGEQKNVPSFLYYADIAVAISGGGGISNAAIEMMASGKPVVAWDNLTYSQLITHGKSGHLVKDRDSRALAQGIELLIDNPEYASTLTKNAQIEASNYDWNIISQKFLSEVAKA